MTRVLLIIAIAAVTANAEMKKESFGKLPDGRTVERYTLANSSGFVAKIMTYGAILTELHVPNGDGTTTDIVMGFDTLDGYLKGHPYFGANVGRCANRIANAQFKLDGKAFQLAANNAKHSLHGGKEGFDKKLWTVSKMGPESVTMSYSSPDGEEGYPGALTVNVQYELKDRMLIIIITATTDATTICNIAHHSYFNLAGHNSGDILGHELKLHATTYTPADETLIPTGKIDPVAGTPFDFTTATPIGKRIREVKSDPVGYDLNYVIDRDPGRSRLLAEAAIVTEPKSGRMMTIATTEPGIQFYTGNYLDGKAVGKGGAIYKQYGAFCLEPQKYPDAVNKAGTPGWPNVVLKPGESYSQTTSFAFGKR
jgi:aldose 1-epimerase